MESGAHEPAQQILEHRQQAFDALQYPVSGFHTSRV
jgi:hypothetical protein